MLKQLSSFSETTPQGLVLVGPKGSGKETVLRELTKKITTSPADAVVLEPLEDKKQISIDQCRELKRLLSLRNSKNLVILVPNAELLTIEAQNSILKILEETPRFVHFFMAVPSENSLLETIKSRVVLWNFKNPSTNELKHFFNDTEPALLEKALIISGNKPGLTYAILNQQSNEKINFFEPIEYAKELLSEPIFDRLIKVNSLAKDNVLTTSVLDALAIICQATIKSLATANDLKKIIPWQKRLEQVEEARNLIEKNVQTKLVLGRLFLML